MDVARALWGGASNGRLGRHGDNAFGPPCDVEDLSAECRGYAGLRACTVGDEFDMGVCDKLGEGGNGE